MFFALLNTMLWCSGDGMFGHMWTFCLLLRCAIWVKFFMQSCHILADNMGSGKSPTVEDTQRISFLLAEGLNVSQIHCRMVADGLAGQNALSSGNLGTSLGLLREQHGRPHKRGAGAVPHGATEGDSLTLLSGDAPASQGDDLPHSWEAPTSGASLQRAVLGRETVSEQDCAELAERQGVVGRPNG